MIRWYALNLYDFMRDYTLRQKVVVRIPISYMRVDEDSFIHSPIT
jgi:hypothetical protein